VTGRTLRIQFIFSPSSRAVQQSVYFYMDFREHIYLTRHRQNIVNVVGFFFFAFSSGST